MADNPQIRFTTDLGVMTFELFEDVAPNTVANIITLAENGFYEGMTFHRVIPDFMAQGGCPHSKGGTGGMPGTGGPGYYVKCETSKELPHNVKGLLSMANAGPNTNGSQFFMTFVPCPWLDGNHTVFGKILEGESVLEELENIGSPSGRPKTSVGFNIEVISKRDHEYKVVKL